MSVLTIKQQKAAAAIQAAGCFGIPELKNPRYLACFKDGRKAHLKAALANQIADPKAIPLYSHHQTRQSLFEKGWRSVTELDRLRPVPVIANLRYFTPKRRKSIMPDSLLPQAKSAFKSRTVIGGVIAVGAGIAGLFGVPVDAGTQASLASTLVDLASAVGGLLAIWGRIKATHTVR
ncbi:hypothetical protein [Aeromonas veronii]|nr:hypothetical protein [Aeromonas veronii]